MAPVTGKKGKITNNKTGSTYLGGLSVLWRDTSVTDMGIGQSNNLPGIRRIGEDFLISGHRGIENDFSTCFTITTNGDTVENAAVLKSKYGDPAQNVLLLHNSALSSAVHKRARCSLAASRPFRIHILSIYCSTVESHTSRQVNFSNSIKQTKKCLSVNKLPFENKITSLSQIAQISLAGHITPTML